MCHSVPPGTWKLGAHGGPWGIWKWHLPPSSSAHGGGCPVGRLAGYPAGGPEGGSAGHDLQVREASHCPWSMIGGGRRPCAGGGRCGEGPGGHGAQDPALQPGDSSVHSGFLGLSTANPPADNPCQIKHTGGLLTGQGSPRITLKKKKRGLAVIVSHPLCSKCCQALPGPHIWRDHQWSRRTQYGAIGPQGLTEPHPYHNAPPPLE